MNTNTTASRRLSGRTAQRCAPLIATAVLLTGSAACAGQAHGPAASDSSTSSSAAADQSADPGGMARSGSGPVNVHSGSDPSGSDPSGSGQRATAVTFSLQFAQCMRAHGVPKFPDPQDAKAGWLAPGSGVDPGSAEFQGAINGPCRSLAPAAWLSNGQVGAGS
jgi:hypothetical protein